MRTTRLVPFVLLAATLAGACAEEEEREVCWAGMNPGRVSASQGPTQDYADVDEEYQCVFDRREDSETGSSYLFTDCRSKVSEELRLTLGAGGPIDVELEPGEVVDIAHSYVDDYYQRYDLQFRLDVDGKPLVEIQQQLGAQVPGLSVLPVEAEFAEPPCGPKFSIEDCDSQPIFLDVGGEIISEGQSVETAQGRLILASASHSALGEDCSDGGVPVFRWAFVHRR